MSTSPAATALDTALAGLAARMKRPVLLVALDFDGTLSPLRDDPNRSRILRTGVAALRTLATRDGVEIALVSGRALADLHLRAEVPVGTHLVGSHGAERGVVTADGVESVAVTLDAVQQALLDKVGAALGVIARAREGVWVEHKPTAHVLHTRRASVVDAELAIAETRQLAASLGTGVMRGKDIVELTVVPTTKAEALTLLRHDVGATTVLFAGDDVTDEVAFQALGPADIAIKVGTGSTKARYRVPDPEALCQTLQYLAELVAR
jgi:trehalose 6-phosphate phosphatase